MSGAQPVVVFWFGWGIHVMVVLSFLVQVTLLLLADIRRRKDWPVLKVIIWTGYTLADMTAVYALGHMSVLCSAPEHHLMALWAPLLLVHLGGQDNITAYAIEDNQLWLRHLQTFVLQVVAAGYVLYASTVFSRPSLLRSATILMSVVGVLKYGERVWSLRGADKYASSSLSATSYKDFRAEREYRLSLAPKGGKKVDPPRDRIVIIAHSLLHVPKQMFKGPTRYVKNKSAKTYSGEYMLKVAEAQLSMMYDLLYTKAAVVHTVYGMCIRVISLPFTVAALLLFHAMRVRDSDGYRRADVIVTNLLLTGAVVLEAMSLVRSVFSMWTAALLAGTKWHELASAIASAERGVIWTVKMLMRSEAYWSGYMRKHNMFKVFFHTDYSTGSKLAKSIGREDWWDSMFYSRSTRVPAAIMDKVLELVSTAKYGEVGLMSRARGVNAVNRREEHELVALIKALNLELADSFLVWHIATNVYISWYNDQDTQGLHFKRESRQLSNYMFFLLAARPYMLPYPVTRHRYVQLCHDSVTHLRCCTAEKLRLAVSDQKVNLMKRCPLQPDTERSIIGFPSPVNNSSDNKAK
ncbi:hypothetical protein ACQ4PT_000127 [Festuca glaucescens]